MIQYSSCLVSLSVMSSWNIHVITNVRIFFFLMVEWYSFIIDRWERERESHNFFILSSIDGHWRCFQILATMLSHKSCYREHACTDVFGYVFISFGHMPKSGIAESWGVPRPHARPFQSEPVTMGPREEYLLEITRFVQCTANFKGLTWEGTQSYYWVCTFRYRLRFILLAFSFSSLTVPNK